MMSTLPLIDERLKTHPQQILIRVQFTNPKLLVNSIRIIKKTDEQKKLKKQILGIEPGTRNEVDIINIGPFLFELLKDELYYITDIHAHKVGGVGTEYGTRYILTLMFSTSGAPYRKLNRDEIGMLHQLCIKDSWKHFKYDRNPNGIWSLTCLHRIPNSEAGDEIIGELHMKDQLDELPGEISREAI